MPNPQPRDLYDVTIIGAGPAGLAAAVYAARQGLQTAVVFGAMGGQLTRAHKIENFIGFTLISGPELLERFREHVRQFDVDCFEGNLVNAIVPVEHGFDVFSREGLQLSARTVIIASGKAPARLAIPGEEEMVGRGVSYCATCDAAFFVGKPVVVIGPGESAADAALQLAELGAEPVTLVNRKPIGAPAPVLAKLEEHENVTVEAGVSPLRIEGEEHVTGLVVSDEATAEERTIEASGVFIEMGSIKAEEFATGLVELNDAGEIVVDKRGATSTLGIYAAGDVTDDFGKQIIIAAGQGARAAMAVWRDLKRS
ncbi:MAG: FAD-dependent oxidoreductase [Coriobacteriales bacterium]|nr:FAD-dependent oxidoreductase [Coriobacteriales bacterium]